MNEKLFKSSPNNENSFLKVKEGGSFLVISKDGPDTVNLNQEFEYRININNIGAIPATPTIIEDIIPTNLQIISVDPSLGTTIVGQKITFNIDSIDVASEKNLIIKVKAITVGTIINTASVNSPLNDNTQTTAQKSTTIENQPPLNTTLKILKTADKSTVNVGDNISYLVSVENTGVNPSTETIVQDYLPNEVQYLESIATTGTVTVDGKNVKLVVPSIPPTKVVTLAIRVKAIKTGDATNKAVVSASNNTNPSNEATVAVNIGDQPTGSSFLVISKDGADTVDVNSEFDYKITVANEGDKASTQTIIEDTIPDNLQIVSVTPSTGTTIVGQKVTYTLDSIDIASETTLSIKVKANKVGSITNKSIVTASNNTNKQNTAEKNTIIKEKPGSFLQINKTSKDSVVVGDEFDYVITLQNTGVVKSTYAYVADYISSNLQIISAKTSQGTIVSYPNQHVDASIGEIEVSKTVEIVIRVKAIKSGTVSNTATVTADNNQNPDKSSTKTITIKSIPTNEYTTGILAKQCCNNRLKIALENTTTREYEIKFTAQNLNNSFDKKDFVVKIPPIGVENMVICDLPRLYKITFDNIDKGIHVLILSCCNCSVERVIRQIDLIPVN